MEAELTSLRVALSSRPSEKKDSPAAPSLPGVNGSGGTAGHPTLQAPRPLVAAAPSE